MCGLIKSGKSVNKKEFKNLEENNINNKAIKTNKLKLRISFKIKLMRQYKIKQKI
jgi:hypothetical protein